MAKTIAFTAKLVLTEGDVTMLNSKTDKTQIRESTLTAIHHTVQSVAGTEEALSVGDVNIASSGGADYVIQLWNRDTGSGYVEVLTETAAGTYHPMGKMLAGEPFGPIRRAKNVNASYGGIFLKGSTAGPRDVEVLVSSAGDPEA